MSSTHNLKPFNTPVGTSFTVGDARCDRSSRQAQNINTNDGVMDCQFPPMTRLRYSGAWALLR
ncbi:hypothetical protein VFPPC_15433 [Pochonia chlamydosporia 170]|uniref:Uncharacterized protein n=1 Tax=Pochonia chlamydosporia 170 TaxID=1380566 RepID=A0A179G8W2_METCM|nr:hypothetical protein VFPPC_15433 [Pochonia chlamydosporia 170]OAQ74247.1 hypothetical protein VFPPC_15433 [Pochonia chlamydosporia 170]